MKTIGIIGGMSWESTVTYYQIINETIKDKLGGFHSAKMLIYNVDFAELEACLESRDWEKIREILTLAALKLESAGADFILIATNTMHMVAPDVAKKLKVPLLHIAKATSGEIIKNGIKKVALLGTRFTMKEDFYKGVMAESGIETLIPDEKDMEFIDRVIFQELCLGTVLEESKKRYIDIIGKLKKRGAEGVVLGCTEIGMLIKPDDVDIPVFDTTIIHSKTAALTALE